MMALSTHIGQPEAACLTADKWQLLNALSEVAEDFGLTHRSISVLKALMTFLPDRKIGAQSVVFPSNQTLSQRLNGMPESTLRRHLSALVKSGLLTRRDSPNRKRYAKSINGRTAVAFGFDLAPLRAAAADILDRLAIARQRAEKRSALHSRLLELCHQAGDTDLTIAARKALRRRNNDGEIEAYIDALHSPDTNEMSGSDIQNERQLQKADKKIPVKRNVTIAEIRQACPSTEEFYPGELKTWQDIERIAWQIGPMMGIEKSVQAHAEREMGTQSASVTVLNMLEKAGQIQNPGGYLRRLTQLAKTGGYDASRSLCQTPKLSADNRNIC